MTVTITHTKVNQMADWLQTQLDAQIALGNFPPGTTLSQIVLPSDWNDDHTLVGMDTLESNVRDIVLIDMGNANYTLTLAEAQAPIKAWLNVGTNKTATYPTTSDGKVPAIQFFVTAFASGPFSVTSQTGADPIQITAPDSTIISYATSGTPVDFYSTLFDTPIATTNSKGNINSEQFVALSAAYNLTNTTSTQKLFDATANGALTVDASTAYFFECQFNISSMSATSGNLLFDVLGAGTATVTSCGWTAIGRDATTLSNPNNVSGVYIAQANATGDILFAATATAVWVNVSGIIRINGGGTIIPSIGLTTAAAAVVGANSFFRIRAIGSNTVTSVGNWS